MSVGWLGVVGGVLFIVGWYLRADCYLDRVLDVSCMVVVCCNDHDGGDATVTWE